MIEVAQAQALAMLNSHKMNHENVTSTCLLILDHLSMALPFDLTYSGADGTGGETSVLVRFVVHKPSCTTGTTIA